MRIEYSKKFDKNLRKSPKKVKIAFRNRIIIFTKNANTPQLRNHALTGKYKGYRSINIKGDWRAIFKESGDRKVIRFYQIGTHSQLYK